jgi:cytochrome b561
MSRHGYLVVLLHWLMAFAAVLLLGLGWALHESVSTAPEREYLAELHVSLGLTLAVLAVLSLGARALTRRPAYPEGFAPWRKLSGLALEALIYLVILVLAASGYLRAVFAGETVQFWGQPLPQWGEADSALAELAAQTHTVAAIALAALILLHLLAVIANSVAQPGFLGRMSPFGARAPLEPLPTPAGPAIGAAAARGLARRLRLFGWLQFWVQFVFALLAAVLLQFVTSGRALSAATAGMGEAIYWAGGALVLLIVTCALGFHYTRAARKIAAAPYAYLDRRSRAPFWSLGLGLLFGFLGIVASFVGVALSISLLIAKTVSQPPGIAITDPSKIIRALDVFVLLVNYGLLLAHFVGAGASLWLQIAVSKARMGYFLASQRAE